MTIYLDIHDTFFNFRPLCYQLMAAILDFVILALAQLTDDMDPMYIIPKIPSEPHGDAHVICFLNLSKFDHQGPKKQFLFCSRSAHRQDGPY